jgi:hypothetical protein
MTRLAFYNMTLNELGQKIKQKYPQYKNIEDTELANMVIKKHPQYSKQITENPADKSMLGKFADKSGKVLDWGAKTFINPMGRAIAGSVVRPYKQVQKMIPGGKTGDEPVNTPWGTVNRKPTIKEAVSDVVEVGATFLPAEKLLLPLIKKSSKIAKSMFSSAGEVLTGVSKTNIDDWFNLVKKTPDKANKAKKIIEEFPDNPYLGLANKINNKLTGLKETAKTSFNEAVGTIKKNFPDTTFNLENKMPELNKTLNKFRLSIQQTKDKAGNFLSNAIVKPTTRTSPYTPQEIREINNLVGKMRVKDMSVDELLDFEKSVKKFLDDAIRKDNKELMKLGYDLVEDSAKFIDEVFPEVEGANKLYSNYYTAMKGIGKNLVDKSGQVKNIGAESYLGNILNLNKGVQRDNAVKAGKKLGIDILEEVKNIRNAKQLTELIPNTVKSRAAAVFRSIISAKSFGVTAGAGAYFNPAVGVPALVLNILSSPNRYRGLLEILADTSRKLPISEIIKKLSPREQLLIQNIVNRGVRGVQNATDQD